MAIRDNCRLQLAECRCTIVHDVSQIEKFCLILLGGLSQHIWNAVIPFNTDWELSLKHVAGIRLKTVVVAEG